MYRSLYIKIILIFVMFMITVMAVVGTVLLNSVFSFYTNEFVRQTEECFDGGLKDELLDAMDRDDWVNAQKGILRAYSTNLGIDVYRNYYILDTNGKYLDGSNEELGRVLAKTPNMLNAMVDENGNSRALGNEFSDFALKLDADGKSCIIYIKDSQEEMRQLSWELFSIVLQAVIFGLLISFVLAFFLAKAITAPIQNLTEGVGMVMSGHYDYKIELHSRDEIGTLTGAFNDMGDVLRTTMDEVKGEKAKLETVFSYLKDAVIAFKDNGEVLDINKTARKLFGKTIKEGFNVHQMFRIMNAEYASSYIANINRDSNYVLRDIEYGGKILDINLGYLRYIENNTPHIGCIVVMHDISERYELDKSQREFVANVSHELKTPLTGIHGAAESMLIAPDMPEDMRNSFLNITIEESERMLNIINDLLVLSRFDNNKINWNVSRFDMAHTLRHVCEVMRTVAMSHGHAINLTLDGDDYMMKGDKERLEQVIINIVSNSVKYTPENGRIDVKAFNDGECIKITVRDNGVGIPQGDLDRLFERFYRVEKSRTTEQGGTGLGLAIAKEIVDAHGGDISIKSRVGQGTMVIISLPIECTLSGENDD
ncbi:MAG: HAMP domain-containing protein [Clostridia bacterium]|nr:HAMP domain-containing protein [Clostridia bacterium]